MATIIEYPVKCKGCGSQTYIQVSEDVLKCKSCRQLFQKPKENADLLERANALRFETKDFDEAAKLYEEVIRLTPDEAEAYWGKVLCRYGIEYVKDRDGEYLPTCHRTLEASILEDADYLTAVAKAKGEMKDFYETQAHRIDSYQGRSKAIAAKEDPFDVFISFKATDEDGEPTEDSLEAQKIYYYLTKNMGLKVFFSNITLKNRAGMEYEPIIYAALVSAPVMVLVGSKPDYINATWVKNEWSRYVRMMEQTKGRGKEKYLIPALKGMKPEQLPSVLASYQAVNLEEFGAMERMCSNIDALLESRKVKNAEKAGSVDAENLLSTEAQNLCDLGFLQLSSGNLREAEDTFRKALEKKSSLSLAYWGRLLASEGARSDEELGRKEIPLTERTYYKLAVQYGDRSEKNRYEQTAKKCAANWQNASIRQKHNEEYHTEVKKLKENFRLNFQEGKSCPIDEKADALFNSFFQEGKRAAEAGKRCEYYSGRRHSRIIWGIIMAVVGILMFVCMNQMNGQLRTLEKRIKQETGISYADIYFASSVKNEFEVSELLEDGKAAEKLDLTFDQQRELLSTWNDTYIQNISSKIESEFLIFYGVMGFAVPLLITILIMRRLDWGCIGWVVGYFLWAILIAVIGFGLLDGVVVPGFLKSTLSAARSGGVNSWLLASVLIAVVGIVLVIRGFLRNTRLRSMVHSSQREKERASRAQRELAEKLVLSCAEHVDQVNAKYRGMYRDEIEEFESKYNVAAEAFGLSREDIQRLFGV